MTKRVALLLAAMFLLAGPVLGLTPGEKCKSAKLKIAGKYGFCRLNAESKAVKTGGVPEYSKCDAKYGSKWIFVETSSDGMCPSSGDQSAIQSFIAQHTDDLAAALDGAPLPSCTSDLSTCNTDLGVCTADLNATQVSLTSCASDLSVCSADLAAANVAVGSCNATLSTCNGDLATCNGDLASCATALGTCPTDLATCLAAPHGQLRRTGQTTCYDATGTVIPCAGTGQDGESHRSG